MQVHQLIEIGQSEGPQRFGAPVIWVAETRLCGPPAAQIRTSADTDAGRLVSELYDE